MISEMFSYEHVMMSSGQRSSLCHLSYFTNKNDEQHSAMHTEKSNYWVPECTKITLLIIKFSRSINRNPGDFQYFQEEFQIPGDFQYFQYFQEL